MKRNCKTCDYFSPSQVLPLVYGKCRRHPPTWHRYSEMSNFPQTSVNDWCGEYKRTAHKQKGGAK